VSLFPQGYPGSNPGVGAFTFLKRTKKAKSLNNLMINLFS